MFNLGLGVGLSVKQLVNEFSHVSGQQIPCVQEGRRVGDVDSLICNGDLAKQELGWSPTRDVTTMCKFHILLVRRCIILGLVRVCRYYSY